MTGTAVLRGVARHRELAVGLARRDLLSPFSGSIFGVAWALLHPLLQMAVYLVVFTFVFQMRFGAAGTGADYQTYLLSGMLSWMAWASLLPTACSAVLGNASLVKQADFPSEVLPVRTVLVALVPHLVSLAVLMAYTGIAQGDVPWTWGLLPVALALQVVAMLGIAFSLAALCVFVRDLKEIVVVFCGMGIFLTPAFYTPEMLAGAPEALAWVLELNPFTHFMRTYRDCLFWGAIRHPESWLVSGGLALVVSFFGLRAFERLRLFFGNVL